ncbi:SDR family NAD(P)-dependent oxidoreductase [Allokutzneria albata]|uniref:NAD(P)-dependent dehydrogenase, short-chain alcohol dehydrogenase family n=1 Tax=Allokutzneria albata TaxID=211114 RepID=A0A1G9S485_ALLAB|nr:SDR family NAD(P)-dependent oxidoreductase [Allokutzneria albata]SDM30286.1 NAD(P)-dependent dehydrogenase, short-chain alcohol dehydrogenase family [Allokutzneria albata]
MNTNEVALVTGGNKGIGREIVQQLAGRGFTVYLGARRPVPAPEGLDIRPVRLDVTDPASVEAAVRTVEAEAGRLDVLVNNAGIMVEWGVETVTAAHLRETYEVNVFGVATMISACAPLLRRAPNARIVNMSSGLGSLTLLGGGTVPGFLAYSSSKAALNAVTLFYANAFRADGIKVNAVSPGLVPTDQNTAAPFPRGDRTTADGAAVPVQLATLPVDGPTGVFRGPNSVDEVIPW